MREFGRYPHTVDWRPGDLLLTRDHNPDFFSRKIVKYQIDGGYHKADAEWTHAAVYVGDNHNVCEATVPDWRLWKGRVILTHLFSYCGGYDLRLRRSKHIDTPDKGWRMVVEAMTQLGKPYDVERIIEIAMKVNKETGFWTRDLFVGGARRALICSTLYADSHNKVAAKDIGEKSSGVSLPAYLSQCGDFDDIPLKWAQIANN